jgi:alpha-glucosidase
MQYIGQLPVDRLTLHVYPGDGESQLYEDDGHSWAFRDGEYRLTRFALSTNGSLLSRLDLRRQVEGRYKPGYRDFEVVIHGMDRLPRTALADGQPIGQYELDAGGPAIRLYVGLFERLTVEWA